MSQFFLLCIMSLYVFLHLMACHSTMWRMTTYHCRSLKIVKYDFGVAQNTLAHHGTTQYKGILRNITVRWLVAFCPSSSSSLIFSYARPKHRWREVVCKSIVHVYITRFTVPCPAKWFWRLLVERAFSSILNPLWYLRWYPCGLRIELNLFSSTI